MIVRPASPESLTELERRTGAVLTRNATGIEVVRGSKVRGIAAFDGWTTASCQAHVCAVPWATLPLVKEGMKYIFLQLGLATMYGAIRGDNKRALAFAGHAGFEDEHRLKDAYGPGVDLVLVRMRRVDYMLQFAGLEAA